MACFVFYEVVFVPACLFTPKNRMFKPPFFKCQTPMLSSKDMDNRNDNRDTLVVFDIMRNKDEASMNENGTWNYLKQRRNLL